MTCVTTLVCSMYVDGELDTDAYAQLEQHLHACAACRERIDGLRSERLALRMALMTEDSAAVPAFVPPLGGRTVAIGSGLALAAAAAAFEFWRGLAAAVPSGLRWLNPFSSGELLESGLRFTRFLIEEGNAMLSSVLNSVGAVLVGALCLLGARVLVRRRAGTAALLSALVVVLALPTPGHALEIRRANKGIVTVAAGETINDSLLAAGETVVIDGDVNGDLIAAGRSVTVRGKVSGNVISGAETISIEGAVGGSVLAAGRGIKLAAARVTHNLYGFGRDIAVGQDSDVSGNALTFGESTDIAGRVGSDSRSFGNRTTISGTVLGDAEAHGERVDLLPSARVGGNLTTHTGNIDEVRIAAGAVVGGKVDRRGAEHWPPRNRYATAGFYVGQVVKLGAAFLAGLLLLWMFPALRALALPGAVGALGAAGIGLAAAVTLPIAALLVCLTIVGLPIGIATFALGALGLYLAKPVIGQLVGRLLLRNASSPPHYALTLLVGLVVVIIAINLPYVGPLVSFAATIIGFGMIVKAIYARFSRRPVA